MNHKKIELFDIFFSPVTQQEAVSCVLQWVFDFDNKPKVVVTPNLNLTILQTKNPLFKQILNAADLCLVDGKPVFWASKLFDVGLPEVVTGSDLVPAIFAGHQKNHNGSKLNVFLLGAAEGVATRAGQNIMQRYSAVNVCGAYSPPFGFEKDEQVCARICQMIQQSKADILVIGLGAPKQEFWAYHHLQHTGAKVAICAGATIDFMAGEKPRAPRWMQKVGLEWLFRLLSEPKRLAGRYWNDGIRFPSLLCAEFKKRNQKNRS